MGVLQPDEDQAGDHDVGHLWEDNRDHDVVDLLMLMKKWIWENADQTWFSAVIVNTATEFTMRYKI